MNTCVCVCAIFFLEVGERERERERGRGSERGIVKRKRIGRPTRPSPLRISKRTPLTGATLSLSHTCKHTHTNTHTHTHHPLPTTNARFRAVDEKTTNLLLFGSKSLLLPLLARQSSSCARLREREFVCACVCVFVCVCVKEGEEDNTPN